jgi:hypothetical protein
VAANGLLVIIFLAIGIAAFAFWIWAIVDVVKVPDDSMFKAGNKLIWVLVIVLTGVIGAIIYLVVGRPEPGSQPARPGSIDPNQPPPPPPGALG